MQKYHDLSGTPFTVRSPNVVTRDKGIPHTDGYIGHSGYLNVGIRQVHDPLKEGQNYELGVIEAKNMISQYQPIAMIRFTKLPGVEWSHRAPSLNA